VQKLLRKLFMTRKKKMPKETYKLLLELPDELGTRLKTHALVNKTSMNGFIRELLEENLPVYEEPRVVQAPTKKRRVTRRDK
jgi:hypothetical protein